jgi:hypothetical protein
MALLSRNRSGNHSLVRNLVEPSIESYFLDALTVAGVQAAYIDGVALQSFLLGHSLPRLEYWYCG